MSPKLNSSHFLDTFVFQREQNPDSVLSSCLDLYKNTLRQIDTDSCDTHSGRPLSKFVHCLTYGKLMPKLIRSYALDAIEEQSDINPGATTRTQDFIQAELGHLPEARRHKVVCENARRLYRFGA